MAHGSEDSRPSMVPGPEVAGALQGAVEDDEERLYLCDSRVGAANDDHEGREENGGRSTEVAAG